MKIKDITYKKPDEFQPITLEITIESRQELKSFVYLLDGRLQVTDDDIKDYLFQMFIII